MQRRIMELLDIAESLTASCLDVYQLALLNKGSALIFISA
jgi:hypothetical protein